MGSPDLGETLWKRGVRGRVVVANIGGSISVADYGNLRELSGFIMLEDGKYCITVATKQKAKAIAKIVMSGGVGANGILDVAPVIGDSGEQYRMIRGSIIWASNLTLTE